MTSFYFKNSILKRSQFEKQLVFNNIKVDLQEIFQRLLKVVLRNIKEEKNLKHSL
jgi:hypothetical protein